MESYFGMRKIEVKDGKVLLNDRPLYQRLVLDQGYFPEGILTAPADEDLRRDIELAKEMGFNGARKHQKVEDPRWLFWADTLGFLVWGEMANAYQYSPGYVRRMTAEWQEAVNARLQPPLHRRLGPDERELGRPQPLIRPLADRAPPRPLPPDALPRPYQARRLQRRLGARASPTSAISTTIATPKPWQGATRHPSRPSPQSRRTGPSTSPATPTGANPSS